ncbi:hypothetical protein HMPREF9443_00887 [Phascolarctobacterium succinatutens YIT 12067]|uniref:Uncharacterized protein n=1 Tax=Phascolarctobacterium succinatutens YIT 12067 TaxID=626939 RepID=E8LDG0_9FIRM|nr:hypothetical protein HMPREF9443_00887 [Phascolarctobacterium succinatutens YIT 12067]
MSPVVYMKIFENLPTAVFGSVREIFCAGRKKAVCGSTRRW